MRWLFLCFLFACTQPAPQNETDIPFCYEDKDCTIYRSRCGKIKALNAKFLDYVDKEFKTREAKMNCGNYPDNRRYGVRCEYNSCILVGQ